MASLTSTRFTRSLNSFDETESDHAVTPGANYYEGCIVCKGANGAVDGAAGLPALGVCKKTILNAKAGDRVVVHHGAFDLNVNGTPKAGDGLVVVDNQTLAAGDGTGGILEKVDHLGKRWALITKTSVTG